MIADEFDRLWAAQSPLHPVLRDAQFESRIRDLIFFQRPTFWRLNTLSRCQFCPDDALEPKGSWLGQEFLLFEQITKLRIAGAKSRRSDRLSRNKWQEAQRKKAIADLEAHGIANPSRDDIEKWMLWKESNERCPYTGDYIGFDALFREGRYQVEHIWPRSRSLDNSFANKTLCRTDINIEKSNSTPFEKWGRDGDRWHALKVRLADCKLPEHKIRRFIKETILDAETDDFADRQLADTGWAAREARDFLKRLWPDDGSIPPVETVNGRLTAQLRYQWGLNAILNPDGERKSRDDHRHHGVDALTVALTSRSSVKRLADWHKIKHTGAHPPRFAEPWPHFFEQVRSTVAKIIVSYRVQRKLSGPLHEERPLGLTGQQPERSEGLVLTRRKALLELSDREVNDIRDQAVRALVVARAPKAADRKALLSKELRLPDRTNPAGRPIRKVRLLIERQPYAVMETKPPAQSGACAVARVFYELGQSLRHIALYRRPDGSIGYLTETRLQATRNTRRYGSPVRKMLDDGSVLLMSLCPNDMLARKGSDGTAEYLVVRKFNQNGRVFYKPSTMAAIPKPEVSFGPASFADGTLAKVSVDPIGRVKPARD